MKPTRLSACPTNGLCTCLLAALSVIMRPGLDADLASAQWTIYSPALLSLQLDPMYNITWFLPNNTVLQQMTAEYGESAPGMVALGTSLTCGTAEAAKGL